MDPLVSTFNRKRLFAIGTPEECRALSWGFRQLGTQSSSPEITEASLSDLRAAASEADFLVCFVDLGQPVPVNALLEISKQIPGVIIFTQPTPTQLLSVFQLSQWTAVTWDGSSPDHLCLQVTKVLSDAGSLLREKTLIREATKIVRETSRTPSFVEWINAPISRKASTEFSLNPHQISITIGADNSKSHFEIPSATSGPLLELKFVNDRWIPRAIDPGVVLPPNAQQEGLRAGDIIKIGEIILALRPNHEIQRLSQVIHQSTPTEAADLESLKEITNLEDYLQNLLTRSATGELQIGSGLKRASIFLHNGSLDQVFAGPVSGDKALERILTWSKPIWKFRSGDFSLSDQPSLKIQSTDFSIFCVQVRRNWSRISALVPPMNINVDVDPSKFSRLSSVTPTQSRVLAAVSEFRLVRDVLNYCPLRDLEIYDELISFRKSGLIRISK